MKTIHWIKTALKSVLQTTVVVYYYDGYKHFVALGVKFSTTAVIVTINWKGFNLIKLH